MKQTKKKININKSTKKIKFQSLLGGAKGKGKSKGKKGKGGGGGGTPRKVGGIELKGKKDIEIKDSKKKQAGFIIILYRDSSKKVWVLVQQRSIKKFMPGFWGLPGGQLNKTNDKDTLDTAIRETSEETGINVDTLNVIEKIIKINYGKKNNFTNNFAVLYQNKRPKFGKQKDTYELEEITPEILDILRPSVNGKEVNPPCQEPYGHAWTLVETLDSTAKRWSEEYQKKKYLYKGKTQKKGIVGNLIERIKEASGTLCNFNTFNKIIDWSKMTPRTGGKSGSKSSSKGSDIPVFGYHGYKSDNPDTHYISLANKYKNVLFIFNDGLTGGGTDGNAEIRGMKNSAGIPTGAYPSDWEEAFSEIKLDKEKSKEEIKKFNCKTKVNYTSKDKITDNQIKGESYENVLIAVREAIIKKYKAGKFKAIVYSSGNKPSRIGVDKFKKNYGTNREILECIYDEVIRKLGKKPQSRNYLNLIEDLDVLSKSPPKSSPKSSPKVPPKSPSKSSPKVPPKSPSKSSSPKSSPPKSSTNNSDDYIKLKKEIGTKLVSFLGKMKIIKGIIDSSGKGEKGIIATLTINMMSINNEEKRKEKLKEILDKIKIINNLDIIDSEFVLNVGKIFNDDDDIKKKIKTYIEKSKKIKTYLEKVVKYLSVELKKTSIKKRHIYIINLLNSTREELNNCLEYFSIARDLKKLTTSNSTGNESPEVNNNNEKTENRFNVKKLVPILRNIKKTKKAQKFINDSKKYLDYCENINAAYKIKHDELNTLMNFFATIALDLPNITVSHGYIRDMMRLFNNFESTKIDLNSYKAQQNEWMTQAAKNKTEIDTKIIKYTLHREGIPEEFHTLEEVRKQQEELLKWLTENKSTINNSKKLIAIPNREVNLDKEYTMDNEFKPDGVYLYNYDLYLKYLNENKEKINLDIIGNKIYTFQPKVEVDNCLYINKEEPDDYKPYLNEVTINGINRININWPKIYSEKSGIKFANTKDTPFEYFKIQGGIIWRDLNYIFDIEAISGYDYEKREYSKIGELLPIHNFKAKILPGEDKNDIKNRDFNEYHNLVINMINTEWKIIGEPVDFNKLNYYFDNLINSNKINLEQNDILKLMRFVDNTNSINWDINKFKTLLKLINLKEVNPATDPDLNDINIDMYYPFYIHNIIKTNRIRDIWLELTQNNSLELNSRQLYYFYFETLINKKIIKLNDKEFIKLIKKIKDNDEDYWNINDFKRLLAFLNLKETEIINSPALTNLNNQTDEFPEYITNELLSKSKKYIPEKYDKFETEFKRKWSQNTNGLSILSNIKATELFNEYKELSYEYIYTNIQPLNYTGITYQEFKLALKLISLSQNGKNNPTINDITNETGIPGRNISNNSNNSNSGFELNLFNSK